MGKFWEWLGKSSANPQAVALSAKGLISGWVPLLAIFIHKPNLSTLPDIIYAIIVAFFSAYSSVSIFVGLTRKLYYTFAK